MSSDPSDVGHTGKHVAVLDIEDQLVRERSKQQIACLTVHEPCKELQSTSVYSVARDDCLRDRADFEFLLLIAVSAHQRARSRWVGAVLAPSRKFWFMLKVPTMNGK